MLLSLDCQSSYASYLDRFFGGKLLFSDDIGFKKKKLFYVLGKGQIISECPYEKIVYPKIATKKFPRFLPWPLRRGQIINFIKPIMLNKP